MPNTNVLFDDFSVLVSKLTRKLSVLERCEKMRAGVTISQCRSLEALVRNRRMSVMQLSREMGVAAATMTRTLDVLERDGFVKRTTSAEDRRRMVVVLTPKGRRLAQKVEKRGQEYLATLFDNIPAGKRKQVNGAVSTLLDAIEEHASCCE